MLQNKRFAARFTYWEDVRWRPWLPKSGPPYFHPPPSCHGLWSENYPVKWKEQRWSLPLSLLPRRNQTASLAAAQHGRRPRFFVRNRVPFRTDDGRQQVEDFVTGAQQRLAERARHVLGCQSESSGDLSASGGDIALAKVGRGVGVRVAW